MIRNVIFDWSGTLADDLGPVLEATNAIFREYGRDALTLADFRHHFRLPFSGFYAEHLPEATAEGIDALYQCFFTGLQNNVTLLPGARDFLDFCHATSRRTFLLTTVNRAHLEAQATHLGVLQDFEHAYVGIRDKREKIREILATHQLDPAETMYIGDMVHDLETARFGGVLDIAVLTGYDSLEKLATAHPSVIVRDLTHLQKLLS